MEDNYRTLILNEIDSLKQKMKEKTISKEDYRKLQILLLLFGSKNNHPVCTTNLTGEKLMFLTDTHFGNNRENLKAVDAAYNKALKENVKTAIHLGDLINGSIFRNNITTQELQSEINLALDSMPNEISTKLILGNHDYYTIRFHQSIGPMFFNSDKLEVLGIKYAVANWDDFVSLGLYHEIENISIPNISAIYTDLRMCGHFHEYNVNEVEKSIIVPASSYEEDQKHYKLEGYHNVDKEAFIIAFKEDESVLFKVYNPKEQIKSEIQYDTKTHKLKKIK